MEQILIENVEGNCVSNRVGLYLGESAAAAFPYLRSPNPTSNSYSDPMSAFEWGLSWIFYEWHRTKNIGTIAESIGFVVNRVRDVNTLAVNDGLRRLHDVFMLQAAILSGSHSAMRQAAVLAGSHDALTKRHAYEWGLAGIYKGAINGDAKEVEDSFALFASSRPSPPHRAPASGLVKAFVADDTKKLASALKQVWRRDWDRLEKKENGVIERVSETLRVSLRNRGPNDLWPWPEAAFAKLAVLRGEQMPSDPLWCPDAFLRAFSK